MTSRTLAPVEGGYDDIDHPNGHSQYTIWNAIINFCSPFLITNTFDEAGSEGVVYYSQFPFAVNKVTSGSETSYPVSWSTTDPTTGVVTQHSGTYYVQSYGLYLCPPNDYGNQGYHVSVGSGMSVRYQGDANPPSPGGGIPSQSNEHFHTDTWVMDISDDGNRALISSGGYYFAILEKPNKIYVAGQQGGFYECSIELPQTPNTAATLIIGNKQATSSVRTDITGLNIAFGDISSVGGKISRVYAQKNPRGGLSYHPNGYTIGEFSSFGASDIDAQYGHFMMRLE